ncbi:MAG: amidase [Chloroflexota bacterium]|nr:amidase [Chloroflexota bacterium]
MSIADGPAQAAARSRPEGFHLEEATIAEVHHAFLAHELTATQLVQLYLARIAAYNGAGVQGAIDPATGLQLGPVTPVANAGQLSALITLNVRGQRSKTDTVDDDPALPDALETAAWLDAQLAATGRLVGPLHGIVFAVKDEFDTRDMRSTSGAAANYANDRPPVDAEVVARLRQAGTIILAKANMGEYASGDRSAAGGTTCNPYDTMRSAGRSSGGSGAAVAANLVHCALGEESGPSVRNPSANNSLVGVVATHSLVSRAGIIPAMVTRDRAGIMCRTVEDAARVLSVIAGYDPQDPITATSVGQMPPGGYEAQTQDASLRRVRIGVIRDFAEVFTEADRDTVRVADEAFATLAAAGATIVDPVDFGEAIRALVPDLEPGLLSTTTTTVQDGELVTTTTPPTIEELVAMAADPTRFPDRVDLRSLTNSGSSTGEARYVLNRYLQARGDPAMQSTADLLANATHYTFPFVSPQTLRTIEDGRVVASRTIPGDGISNPAHERLTNALRRTRDLADGSKRTSPVTTLDTRAVVVRRVLLQQIVAKVMADHQLDALVYPTKTLPAPILGAAVWPAVRNRPATAWTLSPVAGLPTVAVPAGWTHEVLDWLPPEVIEQVVLVDGEPTLLRVYDPAQYDPHRLQPPKAVALPVSIDFLGRPFSEPTLLRIAAAFEAATHHRRPPAAFPALPTEP